MNHKKSDVLFERAKKVSPGGVHSPVRAFKGVGGAPRFMTHAKGAEIFDVDGNRYTDYCLSWGPLIFGHRDPEILEAAQKALERGWSFGTAEPYSLELAELMTEKLPWIKKVRFVNSGTEAVLSALRLARAATGRSKILKFDGCYHGHVDSLLLKAGSGLTDLPTPDSAGVSAAMAQDTIIAPLDDLQAFDELMNRFGKEIAAVIVEPIPANNGLLLQKDGFLKHLRTVTQKHGSLLIFDEVITGFRVALGGMAELTGITPDLVTYGKIIGGGFPVGAYGGREDLMNQVAPSGPVYQAGTLSANPLAMSAGLAMLKKLIRENPYPKLAKECERIAGLVSAQKKRIEKPFHIQSAASLFWPVIGEPMNPTAPASTDGIVRAVSQIPSIQKESFAKIFHRCLEQGIYLAPSGFEVGFLSTAHTEAQNNELAETLVKSLEAL